MPRALFDTDTRALSIRRIERFSGGLLPVSPYTDSLRYPPALIMESCVSEKAE
jgi:hypothetical protein